MPANRLNSDRVVLTEEKLSSLRAHIERTGITIPALLKGHKEETKGITYKIVYDWLTGRIKTADANHYETLIKIFEKFPDLNEEYIYVSQEIVKTLQREKARSGVSTKKLFQEAEIIPEGLTAVHAENIVRDLTKKTRHSYLEFLINEWKKQPDSIPRIPITPEILTKMLGEKERTGIGPMALLRDTKKVRPRGLTTSIIDSWLEGRTTSARKDHLDFALDRWQKLPTQRRQDKTNVSSKIPDTV